MYKWVCECGFEANSWQDTVDHLTADERARLRTRIEMLDRLLYGEMWIKRNEVLAIFDEGRIAVEPKQNKKKSRPSDLLDFIAEQGGDAFRSV